MKLGVLVFSVLIGGIAYAHVTDNMRMPHDTGIAVGLLTGVLVLAALSFWLIENDHALRASDAWHRKHRSK